MDRTTCGFRPVRWILAGMCLLLALAAPASAASDKASDYVGAAGCAPCHREIFEHWSQPATRASCIAPAPSKRGTSPFRWD